MRRCYSVAIVFACVISLAAPSAWRAAGSAEGKRAIKTSYTVLSRSGGAVHIAALEWLPYRAKTVLLAVHGIGAFKENTWGPLVVPGYSFGEHEYAEGRATIAIDLPGYGGSEGNPYLTGVEDFAFVVDQIADDLRRRFEYVVGLGHSLGAFVVAAAQGAFGSFDAIVPGGYSHGGAGEGCKGPLIRDTLFSSYADPRVVDDFVSRTRPPKATLIANVTLWGGQPPGAPHAGPAPDDITSMVTVPVLIILGKADCLFDTSDYAEEPSHYGSTDVKLVVLSRTGHAVFHHLNHRYVDKVVGDWLTKHKL